MANSPLQFAFYRVIHICPARPAFTAVIGQVPQVARPLIRAPRRAEFHCIRTVRQSSSLTNQRYGTANEPPPHLTGNRGPSKPPKKPAVNSTKPSKPTHHEATSQNNDDNSTAERRRTVEKDENDRNVVEKTAEQAQRLAELEGDEQGENADTRDRVTPAFKLAVPSIRDGAEHITGREENTSSAGDKNASSQPSHEASISTTVTPFSEAQSIAQAELAAPLHDSSNALTKILQMPPSMNGEAQADEEDKPPHLQAPRFTHNFDTYTLVNRLIEEGYFSEQQAIDIMKALRGLLAANMDLARDGLVSKADAEMESYLFQAAVSELRTEIRQRRSSNASEMASSRTSLQHEVDILSQRITQDTLTMKDELKGMFDDRKMTVRMERRALENKIQELNYKITIALNSEMRSEVEGLRWVMTRRTVVALIAIVIMSLLTLQYAKYAEQKSEQERKKLELQLRVAKASGSFDATMGQVNLDGMDPASLEARRRIEAGENPSLVSLG